MGNTKAKNNSNKPKQTGKTVTSVKKQNTVEYVIVNILCLFVFIAFAYIAIMSFVQTSVFDSANYGSEVILYQTDNIALNILFTSLFTVFIFKMKKHCDFFAKVNHNSTFAEYDWVSSSLKPLSLSSITYDIDSKPFRFSMNLSRMTLYLVWAKPVRTKIICTKIQMDLLYESGFIT